MKYTNTLLLSAALLVPGLAFAQLVTWTGTDASAAIASDVDISLPAPSDQGLIRNYVSHEIMSTSVDANYGDNSIFAVIQTENTDLAGSPVTLESTAGSRLDAGGQGVWIGVDGNNPAGADSIRGVASLIWFDWDSTAPGATDTISSMSFSTFGNGGISDGSAHFAVQSDGSWYVSSQSEIDGGLTTTYDGTDFAALTVADASSTSLMTAPGYTYIDASTLDNVTAIGVFFEGVTSTTTDRARIKLDSFTAVVPEPSTFAILAGMAALGFVIGRRRYMA